MNRVMPMVLFNIGWMRHYRGQTSSDRIVNGGQYVTDNETGGEIRNFLTQGKYHYGFGYVGGEESDLTRLGAQADDTPHRRCHCGFCSKETS